MRWSERDSSAYLSVGHFRRFLEYLLVVVWLLTASTLLYGMFRAQCWSRGGAQKPVVKQSISLSQQDHTRREAYVLSACLCAAQEQNLLAHAPAE